MAELKRLKILIAGGSGFLGSNLAGSLLRKGHEVTILDIFSSGHEDNIADLKSNPRFKLIRHDIQEPFTENIDIDQIYHLACPASPKQYQRDPVQTLKICFAGTENLLKLAHRCKARILFSSTSEVYGNPLVSPQAETYFGNVNSYGPRSCYDEGKRVAEALCYAYQQLYTTDIRIARIFNAYGPGMPASDGRVVSTFVSQVLKGQDIVITGDGSAIRCFQYVTDCVDGLERLMASDYQHPVNIGNDRPHRISDLANLVIDLVSKQNRYSFRTRIKYLPAPVDDPVTRIPDITLAKNILGWQPVVGLEEGLQKTIDWFFAMQKPKISTGISTRAVPESKYDDTTTSIPFNIPPVIGTELGNIKTAMQSDKLCGDGKFSHKCRTWLQARLRSSLVLLTASGTSSLEMAALLLDFREGDEIIMPSYTFVSTANAFVLRGCKIVFVDIRSDTMNIDESKIEQAITGHTRVIVPVHYAGIPCEMDTIMAIAAKHKLTVIEDAAQGLLSTYKERPLGSIGHIGCLSFHESKNVTAGGQGGAILVNDRSFHDRAEIIHEKGTDRSQFLRGSRSSYTWQDVGSSFGMSEIQAAYLWSQLEAAHAITARRRQLWQRYHELLQPLAEAGHVSLPLVPSDCEHNAHIYYIRVRSAESRSAFMAHMKAAGIGAVSHYSPLHTCTPGKLNGRFSGRDEHTTRASKQLVRLPLFYSMEDGDQDTVITEVRRFIATSEEKGEETRFKL